MSTLRQIPSFFCQCTRDAFKQYFHHMVKVLSPALFRNIMPWVDRWIGQHKKLLTFHEMAFHYWICSRLEWSKRSIKLRFWADGVKFGTENIRLLELKFTRNLQKIFFQIRKKIGESVDFCTNWVQRYHMLIWPIL